VALGKRDEDALTTLAGRLARLDREISRGDAETLRELAGGKSLSQLANSLLQAINPDLIAEKATGRPGAEPQEVAPEHFAAARKALADEACSPFDLPALRDALAKAKEDAEQTIDTVTVDEVVSQGFDAAAKAKASSLLKSFREYIEQHQAEITALQLLYSRPFKQRLTESMLKDLEKKLRDNHAAWTEDRLWDAFALTRPGKVKGRSQAGRFADLVALVRFALKQQPVLAPFADTVNERFEAWLRQRSVTPTSGLHTSSFIPHPFTAEQLTWLALIRDHIATSLSIEPEDLDLSPFNQRGGLGKAHQLFGDQLPKLLDELNEVLAA